LGFCAFGIGIRIVRTAAGSASAARCRSFLSNLSEDAGDAAILKAIIQLGTHAPRRGAELRHLGHASIATTSRYLHARQEKSSGDYRAL
jgi:hypothetical protein